MKSKSTVVIFVFFFLSGFASFAQEWKWLNQITGNSNQTILSGVTDESGNTYVCGKFIDYFITDTLQGYIGGELLFVAKYNSKGKRLWFVHGEQGTSGANSIALDPTGHLYICGKFESDLKFGSFTVQSLGTRDFFISRLDTSGRVKWVRRGGSASSQFGGEYDDATKIKSDKEGNAYWLAIYKSFFTYGDNQSFSGPNNSTGTTAIIKTDTSGYAVWIKSYTQPNSFAINSIEVSSSSLFLCGRYSGGLNFSSTVSLTSANTKNEAFILQLDTSGRALTAKKAVSTGGCNASNLVVGEDEKYVYVTGPFQSTTSWDDISLTERGQNDAYLAKYSIVANRFVWVKHLGSKKVDACNNLIFDKIKNKLVLGGAFVDSIYLGTDTILSTKGRLNSFIAVTDTAGKVLWAACTGTSSAYGTTTITGLGYTDNGDVLVSGTFSEKAYFGKDSLITPPPVENPYENDAFIARLSRSNSQVITTLERKEEKNQTLICYPNPNRGSFIITNHNNNGRGFLSLKNIYGQEVYSEKDLSFPSEVNLPNLPGGVYFATFTSGREILSYKIKID